MTDVVKLDAAAAAPAPLRGSGSGGASDEVAAGASGVPPEAKPTTRRATNERLLRYAILMVIRASTILLKFGLSFYVARVVGLDALGTYGLVVGLSFSAPVLFRAGLFTTIARRLVDADPAQMTDDLKHYLVWVAGCYGLVLLAIPLLFGPLAALPALETSAWVILAIVVGEHLSLDIGLLLNNLNRSEAANVFGLAQSAAWVLPFVVASWLMPALRSLDALLSFWAVGSFVALAGVALLFRNWPWRASPALTLAWYRERLPASGYLFFADVLSTLSQFVDRYMIAWYISLEQAGVYTLFYQLANAVFSLISSSIVNVHRPRIISTFARQSMAEAKTQLRELQLEAVGAFVFLAIVAGCAFHFAAPWLNRQAVLSFMPLMWITFAATALKTWCLTGFIELYARHYDAETFWLNLVGLLLVVALGRLAIVFFGIYGIPASIGISYAVVLLLARFTIVGKSKSKAGSGSSGSTA